MGNWFHRAERQAFKFIPYDFVSPLSGHASWFVVYVCTFMFKHAAFVILYYSELEHSTAMCQITCG